MNLNTLYQEVILDHNKSPRNHEKLASPTAKARGVNPLCGDKLMVYLSLKDGVIDAISFLGEGCAISQASASLMTEALKGKTEHEARTLFKAFHALLTVEDAHLDPDILGKLAIFEGVKTFPARVKCATLAWHTLEAALNQDQTPVSTE